MKNVLLVLFLGVMFAACGNDGKNGTNGLNAPVDASVLSKFTSTDPTSRIQSLDLSKLMLYPGPAVTPQDIALVIDCVAIVGSGNDQSGNSGPVNGIGKNQVGITGSTTSGLIQFGPLSHSTHDANDVCYTVGQEEFSYEVRGSTLTLCDIKYASCSTFTAN